MTTLKHKLNVLCASNDITLLDIMNAYNKKFDKHIFNSSFYRMVNDGNMRYNQLSDMLDSIGYEIVFRRKRDE